MVSDVIGRAHVLQVFESVVSPVFVDMVQDVASRDWASPYMAVLKDVDVLFFLVVPVFESDVAVFVGPPKRVVDSSSLG